VLVGVHGRVLILEQPRFGLRARLADELAQRVEGVVVWVQQEIAQKRRQLGPALREKLHVERQSLVASARVVPEARQWLGLTA